MWHVVFIIHCVISIFPMLMGGGDIKFTVSLFLSLSQLSFLENGWTDRDYILHAGRQGTRTPNISKKLSQSCCCFDCILTVFDDWCTVVHRWYSLGRHVAIGTLMVIFAFFVITCLPRLYQQCTNRQKQSTTVKRQPKQQKWPLVYQSSHVPTESTEHTKSASTSASAEYTKPKCNRFGPKSLLFRTPVPFDAPDGVDPLKLFDPKVAQEN